MSCASYVIKHFIPWWTKILLILLIVPPSKVASGCELVEYGDVMFIF